MPSTFLRTSPRFAAIYSWFHGTRLDIRGPGHHVQCHNAIMRATRIEIHGTGCSLTIGPGARLWDCSITLAGDGVKLFIGADCRLHQTRLNVEDRGSRLLLGNAITIFNATLVAQEGRLLQMGDSGMIAQYAEIRNSDSHAIYNAGDIRLNPAADVVLGHHVWVGLGACIFNGARIGDGAVIGARSLVTGEIPPDCLAFGVPAQIRRTAIRWDPNRLAPSP